MKSTRRFSLPYQALTVVAFILLSAGTSLGQKAARPDRGTQPNRSYSLSDIETISLQNGNVNLSIPLASLPPIAGGKLSWTVSANYNSKLWNVLRMQGEYTDDLEWNPFVVDTPGVDGGWTIGGRYTMFFRNSNEDFWRLFYPASSGLSSTERNLLNNFNYFKMVLRMPDGSEHEFRPVDHSPYAGSQDFLRGYYTVFPSGSAVRYYSVDGTYMFARISGEFNWTVYMPDGTRIIQTPDGIQRIQDTNGNKIKIFTDSNGDHYVDEQANRELRVTFDPAANGGQGQTRVWYPTVTGIQHHIDINYGTTQVQGKTYLVEDWLPFGGGEGGTTCQRTELLSMQLFMVREIVLPQTEPGQPQRKFTFSYNSDTTESTSNPVNWSCNGGFQNYSRNASRGWGELSRMITPSGSIVDYSYILDSQHALLGSVDDLSYQSIDNKKVTHDGTFDEWNYAVSEIVSQASVTSPDGNDVTEQKYCTIAGCSTGKAGLVYRTTSPFKMVERHWTNLTFSGANTASPGGILTFNAVVDFEYTTLLDGSGNPLKMSAKAFQYDFNANITQTTEYDWFDHNLVSRDAQGVPTGVPGSATVLRVVSNSYYNPASTSTSGNVYAKRSVSTGLPLILNATQQATASPGIIQLSYDNQAYNVAPTAGNLTTKAVWSNLDSKWITTSNTYDVYGNIATATDARGKVTQYFYEDSTHALPTRVVADPQNGTGAQTNQASYDFSTGLVTSQTDVNGQLTSIDYTNQLLGVMDPFGRPGITKSPTINISGTNHRRRTTTTYLDSARQEIVARDLNAENDKLLKTRTTADELGRPIQTETTEDGTNYTISVKNRYLNMGQITLTSSAMRSSASATDSWTRVTKDDAGRVVESATFGGATQPAWTGTTGVFTGAVTNSYSANFVTATDQAGRVRRTVTNALGRIVRVDEPDASGNLGSTSSPVQPTVYAYDVFGNLTTVTQGGQTRTFTHDSLSRLRTAITPESGTVSYQYDDNGNLLVKTDARTDPLDINKKVSTHYEYDSLNRVIRRWYNGSSAVSSITHNSPSLPSGVGATDEVKFLYDSQTLPGGAPSFSRGSAIGRLVARTHGSGSNGDYFAHDVLGRQTLKIQQTGAVNYPVGTDYTLSGAVKSMSYPSGRTISNLYDQAGRLSSFSGNLGDGATRTYTTPLVYSPLHTVLKEQFGTATPVYHKIHYNSSAQICDVRASAVNDEWGGELGVLVNHYTTWWAHCGNGPDNNGNVLMSQTIINSVYFEDRYTYDSLNRLTQVAEYLNGATLTGTQQYTYDRWGNRTINPASTLGLNKQFTVDTTKNRLGVPVGQPGAMGYDNAGNLTTDTYTGAGNRTYDAENRITSAWGGNNQAQLYTYDGNGQRIKRTVDGVEMWQVYGLDSELLAEYAANTGPSNPKEEYGYRNGQLLVTASGACAAGFIGTKSWGATNGSIGHNTGQQEGTDWAAYVSSHGAGHMVYGPYDTTFGNGRHRAQFQLQVDNNSGNDVVATLDVVTGFGANVLAQRQIRRNEFTAANTWQWFTVDFDDPCFGYVEARLFWHDNTNIKFRETKITASGAVVNWLIPDHLGSPRMIIDQTGSAANVKRHDYLPFGEELFAGTGGRSSALGYSGGDSVRQQFTSKERDFETGLDYFLTRYYASAQGRFTGADRYDINIERQSAEDTEEGEQVFRQYISQPQQWNRYAYTLNNPLKFVDPLGEAIELTGTPEERARQLAELRKAVGKKAGAYLYENLAADGKYYVGIYTNGPTGKGPAFETINDVAGEIAPIIADTKVVGLSIVAAGTTLTNDFGQTIVIGSIANGHSPGVTGIVGGKLMVFILDPKTDPGKIPGVQMYGTNGQDGVIYPGEVLAHELGHARARMTGDPDGPKASLRLENKVRKLYETKKAIKTERWLHP